MNVAVKHDDQVWDTILDDDETVIWQGRPDAAFALSLHMIGQGAFATFFAGFAVFWMVMAAQAGGYYWMFGLLHFGAGASLLCYTVAGPSFIRRRSFYTLTNKRAFIAKDLPGKGRTLKSYPITKQTELEYRDDDKPSIYFATETRRRKNSNVTRNIGFERLSDARDVLGLLRQIQREQS